MSFMEMSLSEKNSLLYYQGAADYITLDEEQHHLKNFYSIRNAYEVINTLLFPEIENEKARIMDERRKLNPIMLDHMPELLKVYCNIYSLMCKYTFIWKRGESLYTYRKDRVNTYQYLKYSQTPSFMSASLTNKIDPEFYRKKAGILLLEFSSPETIEYLDVNDILGNESAFAGECEILFPPFLYFDMTPLRRRKNVPRQK